MVFQIEMINGPFNIFFKSRIDLDDAIESIEVGVHFMLFCRSESHCSILISILVKEKLPK